MPDEQPTSHDPAAQKPQALAYAPVEEEDEWLDEPDGPDELPPRPRRRLLTPIPLALLGVLLIAGGFIAGVQVEKGESSSGSSSGAAASLASRFAAPRGGGGTSSGKTAGGAGGGFPGTGAGGSRPTTGTVAYLAGNTLYVTNSEGNTVKVNTSTATSVTKTVTTKVKGIYPGETVTVTGANGSGGTISAESISVGSSGGGLAALLGGAGASGSSSGSSSSGQAALFGSG